MLLLRFTDRDLLPLSAVEPCQRVRNARALDNRASVRPLLRKDCLPPLDTAIRRECRLRLLPVGDALFNAGESRLQRYEDSPPPSVEGDIAHCCFSGNIEVSSLARIIARKK